MMVITRDFSKATSVLHNHKNPINPAKDNNRLKKKLLALFLRKVLTSIVYKFVVN